LTAGRRDRGATVSRGGRATGATAQSAHGGRAFLTARHGRLAAFSRPCRALFSRPHGPSRARRGHERARAASRAAAGFAPISSAHARETSLEAPMSGLWCARVAKPTHSMPGGADPRHDPIDFPDDDEVIVPGIILGGKYRLISEIGRGGMGSVWRAEHLGWEAPVALKLMNRDITARPEAVARFEREVRLAAGLRSPH